MEGIFGQLIHDILINLASDAVSDLIRRLLSGEDFEAVLSSGGDVASALSDAFAQQGIDIHALSDEQWVHVVDLLTASC